MGVDQTMKVDWYVDNDGWIIVEVKENEAEVACS